MHGNYEVSILNFSDFAYARRNEFQGFDTGNLYIFVFLILEIVRRQI